MREESGVMPVSRRTIARATLVLLGSLGAKHPLLGQAGGTGGIPSVFIRVLPDRIDPPGVTVSKGFVRVIVQNRSTAPNITIHLSLGGLRVGTISMTAGQQLAKKTFIVIAGSYVLSEANHPAWLSTMTVLK